MVHIYQKKNLSPKGQISSYIDLPAIANLIDEEFSVDFRDDLDSVLILANELTSSFEIASSKWLLTLSWLEP